MRRSFATTIEEALAYYDVQEPKGECVMVIEGKSREEIRSEEKARWEEMSMEEHMELYLGQGMDKKSAMKQVAKDRGVGKERSFTRHLLIGRSSTCIENEKKIVQLGSLPRLNFFYILFIRTKQVTK